jgi:ketosteroid isomerase-like protein
MTDETTPAAGAAAVQTELIRLEDCAMERWRQGDPMGWTELIAPEVTYVDPALTQPIVGHEAYTKYMEALIGKISYGASHYMRPDAAVCGDTAVLTFNYQGSTPRADGTLQLFALWNTTEVYARVDGQWKIIHTHWSFVRHTAPERVDVPVPVTRAPQEHSGILGELMALEAAALQGLRNGNPFAFCDISAPSVTCFDDRTPERIDGVGAMKEHAARTSGENRLDAVEYLDPRVQVHGDAAVLFYRLLSTGLRQDGGVARRLGWNCTRVYAMSGGRWRIVHIHTSLIGGQPPADSASETG